MKTTRQKTLKLKISYVFCLIGLIIIIGLKYIVFTTQKTPSLNKVLNADLISRKTPYIDENFKSSYEAFLENFKVYVYDIKVDLNQVYKQIKTLESAQKNIPLHWIIRKRDLPKINENGQYAFDFLLKNWISSSKFITLTSTEANAYFLNFKCTSLKNSQITRFSGQRFTQQYIRGYIEKVQEQFPENVQKYNFLNHFYICAHDMGVECIRSAPRNFLFNAIGVVNTADFFGHDAEAHFWNKYEDIKPSGQDGLIFNGHRDITTPPYQKKLHYQNREKKFIECKFLAMFLGSTTGRSARLQFFDLHQNRSDFLVGKAYGKEYVNAFYDSKFCLVIRGLTVWTLRFTEVFQYECIPVIISDGYLPPFSNVFNWETFSISIRESEISRIPQILGSFNEDRWQIMQNNLKMIKHHFLYNNPPVPEDAFYITLYEVWLKVRKLSPTQYK